MQVTGLGTQLGVMNSTATGAAAAVTRLGTQIGLVNSTATGAAASVGTLTGQVTHLLIATAVHMLTAFPFKTHVRLILFQHLVFILRAVEVSNMCR